MSAALKQKTPEPTPTPYSSPERAALAHAIAAAADADGRRAALEKAIATADGEVRAARRAVEATTEAIETAKGNTARHLTDVARGTAGEPPQSIRQARAAAIEAADHLEACLGAREALNAELVAAGEGWRALQVEDAAKAVIRVEMRERGVALAARIANMQRQLVAAGSGLQWLLREGVLPPAERGADDHIRRTVSRMETSPWQWETISEAVSRAPFATPTGAQRWRAAFQALKRDATAPLPEVD